MEWIQSLLGKGIHLTIMQMLARSIIVFILALFMLRLAGKRTFGRNTPVDTVIMIMLGAILSRAVTGASPFIPVILSSLGIVLFHRILAWISLYSETAGKLLKGEKKSLYKNGKINETNMKNNQISNKDLNEGVRLQINKNSFEEIEEVFIERNGEISVVKK